MRKEKLFETYHSSHEQLEREPRITSEFYVEEGGMGVGFLLVEDPGCGVITGDEEGRVADAGDAHVRMGLQGEWDDGYANEEHGGDSEDLKQKTTQMYETRFK